MIPGTFGYPADIARVEASVEPVSRRTVVHGIDTIEVTTIDLTLLGHSHYAEA